MYNILQRGRSRGCTIYYRGVGAGGARGASAPPLFLLGVHCTPTFARDDNFLSTTMPLHTYVYRTNGNI